MVSPGLSSTPAKSEPIITELAPAAMALVISPEYLMPPSAMTGMPCSRAGAVGLGDGRDLRHARAGDHARGADGAGPDADLDGVRAGVDQRQRAFVGGHVAGQQRHVGKALLHLAHRLKHARGVAVRRVDGQHVGARARPAPPRAPENRRLRRWLRPRAAGPARPCWRWDISASSGCP